MSDIVCNRCGRAPAGVTHVCPPLEGSIVIGPTMLTQPTARGYADPKEQRIADLERRVWVLEERIARLLQPTHLALTPPAGDEGGTR